MNKQVYFVSKVVFKDAKPEDKPLTEVYVMDCKGGLCGGLYTQEDVRIGDTVSIDLQARDGKARCKIVAVLPAKKPNI